MLIAFIGRVVFLPISSWDLYTIFVIFSTIAVATYFMWLATARVFKLQQAGVAVEEDASRRKFDFLSKVRARIACALKVGAEDDAEQPKHKITVFFKKALIRVLGLNNAEADTEVSRYRHRFNHLEKICLFFSFLTVVAVVGFQTSNSDYENYKRLFMYEYSASYNLFQFEGLFRALNKLVFDHLYEFQFIVIIVSMITNIFMYANTVYYSLRSRLRPHCVLFVYLSIYMLVSFGMLRQICAAAIVLFSFRYIEKKQYFRYLFFTLLACGFHATAIMSSLFFAFVFIGTMKTKKENTKILLRAGLIAAFYLCAIFSNQILRLIGSLLGRADYVGYFAAEPFGIGTLVLRLPILTFLFVFRKTLREAPPIVKMFTGLMLLEASLCFTYYFVPMLGGRVKYYVLLGYAIVIPYCINSLRGKDLIIPFARNRGLRVKEFFSPLVCNVLIFGYGIGYLLIQLYTTEWITKFLMPIRFFKF